MFKGLAATWGSVFPYGGIKFLIYEGLKDYSIKKKGKVTKME